MPQPGAVALSEEGGGMQRVWATSTPQMSSASCQIVVSIWGFVVAVRCGQLLENNQWEQVKKSKTAVANIFFKN